MDAKDSPAFCEVAVPRPVLRTFTYRLPGEMRPAAAPGMRVLVQLGRRKLVGCIDRLKEETRLPRVRPVLDLLDEEPVLPPPLLELCRWVSDYYVAPPGLVVRTALPPGLLAEACFRVRLAADPAEARRSARGARARAVVDRLAEARDGLQAATLRRVGGGGSIWTLLRSLRDEGLVTIREEPPEAEGPVLERQVVRLTRRLPTLTAREEAFGRARRQREAYELLESVGGEATAAHMSAQLGFSRSVLHGLVEKGLAEISSEPVERDPFAGLEEAPAPAPAEPPIRPTPAQAEAIESLLDRAGRTAPGVALLRGVTGSGKTLVYLELLEELVGTRGRSAIVLVPEISLTPQTVARFRARFGDQVAVLHSGLSAGERFDQWRALREGRRRVVIGARSAVFAPVRDPGAIILDEEHEGSYKQSETPRYHARAVAAVRARLEGCLCLLGSATPSLESWANARSGTYRLHELPERVTGHPLPRVELVDLREERREEREGGGGGDQGNSGDGGGKGSGGGGRGRNGGGSASGPLVLCRRLREAVARRLSRGEQVILLLNRRGYATVVQCDACGKVWSCRRCNVSLTFHRRRRRIVCHHCGSEAPPPEVCDECGEPEPAFTGLGTEQVERRVGELFPDARMARMDLDTTGTKWAHFEILDRVRRGEVDILLGTQMIAKGLDLPRVTLVGVVNADVSLNLPDFRASERTFQLLTQVAGRAGRGPEPGEVLVQTARPAHFALRSAARHDYLGFAERELADREGPGYPPHRRLANLVVSGPEEEAVADEATDLGDWIRALVRDRSVEGMDVLGPAPCPIDRLRGRWRWHLLLKADRADVLGAVLRYAAEQRGQPSGSLRLEIDRDPEALL